MNAELFDGVCDMLYLYGQNTVNKVHKFAATHANKKQKEDLLAQFPHMFRKKRNGDIATKKIEQTEPEQDNKKSDAGEPVFSVKTLVGSYGTQERAARDAINFRHSKVCEYQTAIFPSPHAHGVNITVTGAEAVKKLEGTADKVHGWTVELNMDIAGPKNATKRWFRAFKNKTRMIRQM